jgi:putative addiction module component (TIGR02574 family)
MVTSFTEIERQSRNLTVEERARLAESLLESLQLSRSDIELAWAQEIEDRVAAFDRGDMPTYAAEDVFAEAYYLSR